MSAALLPELQSRASAFEAAAQANPFCSLEFTQLLLDQVAQPDWQGLATAPVPASPGLLLYSHRGQPSHWQALQNYYSSRYGPIAAPGWTATDAAAWADALAARGAATATLQPLAQEDAAVLEAGFRQRRWFTRRFNCFGNWYLPCAGLRYADYLQARPSRLRNTLVRKERKFLAGGGRVEIVQQGPDLARAIDAFAQVYARSWKTPEPYPRFVPDWAAACARRGWLRMGVAWLGEVPIAAQFWICSGDTSYIYKLAYDEAQAAWGAGTVLSGALFRHSLDVDQVREIDFLSGDDAYKAEWMTQRRVRVGLKACRLGHPSGLAWAAREWLAEATQRWRHAQAPLAPPASPSSSPSSSSMSSSLSSAPHPEGTSS